MVRVPLNAHVCVETMLLVLMHLFISHVDVEVHLQRTVFTIMEGGNVSVCVSASNAVGRNVTVTLNTAVVTAKGGLYRHKDIILCFSHLLLIFILWHRKDGGDYMGVTKDIVFGPNEPLLEQCVEILLIEDEVVENSETFLVSLVSTDEDVTLQNSMATVTIIDDDCKTYIKFYQDCFLTVSWLRPFFYQFNATAARVVIGFNATSYEACESESVQVCVELSGQIERSIMLSLQELNGEAIGNHSSLYRDYTYLLL